jgi:hypothetical protein
MGSRVRAVGVLLGTLDRRAAEVFEFFDGASKLKLLHEALAVCSVHDTPPCVKLKIVMLGRIAGAYRPYAIMSAISADFRERFCASV